ncbi:acetylornithine and succinylornithine aminotransferase [Leucogyrophana mollusca]|uniref:Acetylornithine and succinylornithine aminotransferase n=1 Tax=Leucogyrophana mollusca TaxID=85980 RepID=A0ACB8C043_9AGAM|nr:acetylornithine and succinylornithine aminotransferase [Leucogyrophana mollusca]
MRPALLTRLSSPVAASRVRLLAKSSGIRYASSTLPTSPSTRYLEPTHNFSPSSQSPETATALSLGEQYILPVYARPPFVLSHGRGSWVWDTDGRKYLDFSAGIAVNALGHADPGVLEVAATLFLREAGTMRTQASTLLHTSNVYHNTRAPQLAELLVTLTQQEGGLGYAPGSTSPSAKVFFANSGTEANEGALKIARKVGKDRWAASTGGKADDPSCPKIRIACFKNSFHGRSMGALSVTSTEKYQAPFRPLLPGVDVGTLNDYAGINGLVGGDTCVVIVEPVQGEGGIHDAEEGWLRALRKRCDEVGAVLIFDEIQCGLYRTGSLWAHSKLPVDCHPDMVTMAKPLANGYPIGAVLLRNNIASVMTAGTHGTTFGGSPMACAVGHHVLSRLSSRSFVGHIEEISGYLGERLALLPKWFPGILEPTVRGRGLIRGLGFKDGSQAGEVVRMARERGVFVLTAGKDAVRLVPSLIIEKEEVDFAVDVLEGCLSSVPSAA